MSFEVQDDAVATGPLKASNSGHRADLLIFQFQGGTAINKGAASQQRSNKVSFSQDSQSQQNKAAETVKTEQTVEPKKTAKSQKMDSKNVSSSETLNRKNKTLPAESAKVKRSKCNNATTSRSLTSVFSDENQEIIDPKITRRKSTQSDNVHEHQSTDVNNNEENVNLHEILDSTSDDDKNASQVGNNPPVTSSQAPNEFAIGSHTQSPGTSATMSNIGSIRRSGTTSASGQSNPTETEKNKENNSEMLHDETSDKKNIARSAKTTIARRSKSETVTTNENIDHSQTSVSSDENRDSVITKNTRRKSTQINRKLEHQPSETCNNHENSKVAGVLNATFRDDIIASDLENAPPVTNSRASNEYSADSDTQIRETWATMSNIGSIRLSGTTSARSEIDPTEIEKNKKNDSQMILSDETLNKKNIPRSAKTTKARKTKSETVTTTENIDYSQTSVSSDENRDSVITKNTRRKSTQINRKPEHRPSEICNNHENSNVAGVRNATSKDDIVSRVENVPLPSTSLDDNVKPKETEKNKKIDSGMILSDGTLNKKNKTLPAKVTKSNSPKSENETTPKKIYQAQTSVPSDENHDSSSTNLSESKSKPSDNVSEHQSTDISNNDENPGKILHSTLNEDKSVSSVSVLSTSPIICTAVQSHTAVNLSSLSGEKSSSSGSDKSLSVGSDSSSNSLASTGAIKKVLKPRRRKNAYNSQTTQGSTGMETIPESSLESTEASSTSCNDVRKEAKTKGDTDNCNSNSKIKKTTGLPDDESISKIYERAGTNKPEKNEPLPQKNQPSTSSSWKRQSEHGTRGRSRTNEEKDSGEEHCKCCKHCKKKSPKKKKSKKRTSKRTYEESLAREIIDIVRLGDKIDGAAKCRRSKGNKGSSKSEICYCPPTRSFESSSSESCSSDCDCQYESSSDDSSCKCHQCQMMKEPHSSSKSGYTTSEVSSTDFYNDESSMSSCCDRRHTQYKKAHGNPFDRSRPRCCRNRHCAGESTDVSSSDPNCKYNLHKKSRHCRRKSTRDSEDEDFCRSKCSCRHCRKSKSKSKKH